MATFIEQAKELTRLLEHYKNAFFGVKNENLVLKQRILDICKENKQLKDKTETLTRLLVRNHKRISDLNSLLVKNENLIRQLQLKLKNAIRPNGALIKNSLLKNKEDRFHEIEKELEKQKSRAEILENMNRKLLIQLQQQRYLFSKIKNMQKMSAERVVTQNGSEIREKNNDIESVTIVNLEPSGDIELDDLKAMVNIALQHGNSIESIKNSLINTGYKKEKIEKVIS